MYVIVINLDRQPGRWESTAAHVRDLGLSPVRFSGTDAGVDASRERKKAAIKDTYVRLFATFDYDQVIIIQDDVRFTEVPELTEDEILVWATVFRLDHICPHAIAVTRKGAARCARRWGNHKTSCDSLARMMPKIGPPIAVEVKCVD